MEVKFTKKFEEILKEESSKFDIDWSLVEIIYVPYEFSLMSSLPINLDKYMVRIRVLKPGGKIPNTEDIDTWFRYNRFIYAMMSKSVGTHSEQDDIMNFDAGTIGSIATQIRAVFRNLPSQ